MKSGAQRGASIVDAVGMPMAHALRTGSVPGNTSFYPHHGPEGKVLLLSPPNRYGNTLRQTETCSRSRSKAGAEVEPGMV